MSAASEPLVQHAGSPPRSGWSHPGFARVADVVYLVAGNVFPPNRQPTAESGMRRVMSAYALREPDALLTAVSQAGDVRDALLAELTVGETYFFREFAALDILEREVLPAARRRASTAARPLRIWSAGCASGAEPFSLAIRLRELGFTSPVSLLGTDVARPRLDAARRGRFTKWSLRGVSAERIARWFDARGPHFQLHPEITASVAFQQLNLIGGEYPTSEGGEGQDLVLCRNVLIYFDMPSVRDIATRLLASLQPDGWLLLGASDPPLMDLVPCRLVMTPHGAAYRRADAPADAELPEASVTRAIRWPLEAVPLPALPDMPAVASAAVSVARSDTPPSVAALPPAHRSEVGGSAAAAYSRADYATAGAMARDALASSPGDVVNWVVAIRSFANLGRLAEAGEVSARALEAHRMDAELHYLHAMLLLEAGHASPAAQAARRALYLDGGFAMGHMLLGDALTRLGDVAGACRAFGNAWRLVRSVPRDAVLLASDGVSAPRVLQIVNQRLHSLACSA